MNPRAFEFYLRSLVAAALALTVVGVSGYEVLAQGMTSGPFFGWAGIIVGVYFGAHVAHDGAHAERRAMEEYRRRETP